jgi:hypothetical protein
MTRTPQQAPPQAQLAAKAAELDVSRAEHIYLSDETVGDGAEAKTVRETIDLRDRLRSHDMRITLYAEGFLDLDETLRGKAARTRRINLRYLDPVPTQKGHYAKRTLKVTAILAGIAGLAASVAVVFPSVSAFAVLAATAAGAAAFAAFFMFVYLSHEKTVFRTMHGRAAALTLTAGLGRIRRLRSALPTIIRAIGDAEEEIGDDTAVFLRAEMREHYRLRTDGVLSEEECSDGTGRILVHFDDEM